MPRADLTTEPWFVALDVDGTIMHEDETIDPAVASAVASARDRGHEVTIATGRSWAGTAPVLDALGLSPEYVVCANGAVTMRRDGAASDAPASEAYERFHIETFDPSTAIERIRSFLPDGRFMVELPDGHRLYTAGMDTWDLDSASQVEFEGLFVPSATRVVVVSPEHETQEFMDLVAGMGLHQVSYAIGWTAWLDIAPDGVSKATALERVRGWQGHDLNRVIAVGDGRNDIEMFTWAGAAGRAVAMGQSPDEVKAAATEVTGGIDEAGLAEALDTLP
ncbi:HAD family hydrolase [Agromyces aureus]|uniref:Haloacid dehalogenase n=1 Tax=Agromyces aureus TaxID=453304 RepID=A0A191WK75_9MICO|nr:HAD family hydrolase [Agromyces aureus]ANJ28612.1 haloacid dehalogenase [Agromyces aureus]